MDTLEKYTEKNKHCHEYRDAQKGASLYLSGNTRCGSECKDARHFKTDDRA